ncbi:MAG: M13 family metallopeptidase [Elusimicrobiales bacterium]|jgi:endothelin-converting enzyme/putative endopeptidase
MNIKIKHLTICGILCLSSIGPAGAQGGDAFPATAGLEQAEPAGDEMEALHGTGDRFFDSAAALNKLRTGNNLKPAISVSPAVAAPARASGVDLAAIDSSVDPCADFYQYSCGSWLKNNPIPDDHSSWGRINELRERNLQTLKNILDKLPSQGAQAGEDDRKLSDMYSTCTDEKSAEVKSGAVLDPYFARIGKLDGREDLALEIARMHKAGSGILFGFGYLTDYENSNMVMAGIDQGGISLPDRDYYLDGKYAEDLKAYEEHVAAMFKLAGDPPEQAAAEAKRVVDLEKELAAVSMDEAKRRIPENIHHKMKLAAFEALVPSFDWKAYFSEAGAPVARMKQIDVNSMSFFSALDGIIKDTPLDSWKSYMRWDIINEHAPFLSSAFVNEDFAFNGLRLTGQKKLRPRWKKCVALLDESMGDALGRDYVNQAFSGNAKQAARDMVRNIKVSMRDDLSGVTWMGAQTKRKALVKLSKVVDKIGYPDKWENYSSLRIQKGDAFGNVERANAFAMARGLDKIGKKTDRSQWYMTAPTVNAGYSADTNDINFPAGILQPPFYNASADNAVNFGALGVVSGHEITHGFDDEGSLYDGDGNLNDWWTPKDAKAFKARAALLKKRYVEYVKANYPKANAERAGNLALGEIIADNGGLNVAYAALRREQAKHPTGKIDGFTPEQRFFLGYSQVWCTNQTTKDIQMNIQTDNHPVNQFRVNGQMSVMPEFQRAFSCGAKDPMSGGKGARVW